MQQVPSEQQPTLAAAPGGARVVVLLQGPRSPFLGHLADALGARGARVERVLLCPGDGLFWRGRPAHRFRGSLAAWPGWLAGLLRDVGATDILGLGDGRPHHRSGFAVARDAGVRVHVLEQGYLRPGFITLERDSLGAWRWEGRAAHSMPPAPPRWQQSFAGFAAMDVAHHLANALAGPLLYPQYRSHELWSPWREWLGWARRAATAPATAKGARRALERLAAHRGPVFLLALQLETDFQLRDHGPEGGLAAVMTETLASFTAHAPADAMLVVKPHPLDPFPWRLRARLAGCGKRVLWLGSGDLEALWRRLSGVVTINSTAGLSALRAGVPVLTLGRAIYAPLVSASGLSAFWRDPGAVDAGRVAGFTAALAAATQVPGSFDGSGMATGAANIADRVLCVQPA